MVERKRKVLVRVVNGDQAKKIAVMLPENSTIEELEQEIRASIDSQASLVLEVGDGFRLRNQDNVSILEAGEIVTARGYEPIAGKAIQTPLLGEAKHSDNASSLRSTPPPYEGVREAITAVPKGFYIRLINAQLARQHAAQHQDDDTVPKGVPAFGGTLVSGNTSLLAIKNEAARLFQWPEQKIECHHGSDIACIPRGDSSCPLCWEKLEFACPTCERPGTTMCPLMQNAGCHHWSHAHCLQKSSTHWNFRTGCPRGCRKELYPGDPVSFTEPTPHILLIWDGDRIDRLTVSDHYRSDTALFKLPTTSVQGIVEHFLRSKGYEAPGICMRIHNRDPVTETVSFYNSTLVSVCPLSAHSYPDSKWFTLFPTLNPTNPHRRTFLTNARQRTAEHNPFCIDLHTPEAPITTCGCTTIGEIFSGYNDLESLVFYVTKRRLTAESSSKVDKEINYLESPEWHPEVEQGIRGISSLLSSLFVLSALIPKKGVVAENNVLATLLSMCRFPPAVRAMGRLFSNEVIHPWEKTALSEALFYTLMDYRKMYDIPDVIRKNPQRVFEVARPFLAQLFRATEPKTSNTDTVKLRAIEEVSITCPLTRWHLRHPIVVGGCIMEMGAYALYDSGELSHLRDTIAQTSTPPLSEFLQDKLHQLLQQSRGFTSRTVKVLNVHNLPNPCLECSPDFLVRELNFSVLIDEANMTDLKVLGPHDLNSSNVVPPRLVVDEQGHLAVLTGQACGVTFLMPRIGELTIDPQKVAQALEPCIKVAKEEDTWKINAFDACDHGLMPSDLDEAVMICLDLSGSMNQPSRVLGPKNKTSTKGAPVYLTRLELMVELFHVLVNRAGSFNSSVSLAIGLITFSSEVRVVQEITGALENFLKVLGDCEANGFTPLYDALDKARQALVEFGSKKPSMRKRIIVISDGEDTNSTLSPWMVASRMYADGVIVDSVQVGRRNAPNLHAISACTGGYRFCPNQSLDNALCIFDLETVLDSSARPLRKPDCPSLLASRPSSFLDSTLEAFKNEALYPIDPMSIDKFPKRAEHPKMNQAVVLAKKIENRVSLNMRLRRIMTEIKDWNAEPHPAIDLYVNDEDITFMKIVIEAPWDDCIYSGGTFLLTCQFPESYPRNPPEIRFSTFVLHPNVSKQGKICIAELGRLWTSDITLKQALSQIYGLLLEPDLEDPTETHATLKYYDDDGTYALAAANAVKRHALKTRGEWRRGLDAGSNLGTRFSFYGKA
ncbi:hypothetical protein AX16_010444 [Volvariella volvacea WC 439]|nr:hypothetical protein AX16_010444 [Volvariella volvacea WC 439]